MFALETPPAGLPFTAKSSLQALLKSRGAVSETTKGNGWIPMKGKTFMQSFLSTNEEGPTHTNNTPTYPSSDIDPNGDQNGDFSYSQKLFHIDDGNLYSIFSPLQGRSYGMKPSFLRKQKCTVQECHGRGRKIHRKGLKFHNFLPSESVTSEKDNDYHDNRWKVHSECKLREEHGTKQIMVSNWFQNIKQANEEAAISKEEYQVQQLNSTTYCVEGSATNPKTEQATENSYNFPPPQERSIEELNNQELPTIENSFSYGGGSASDNKYSFLNNLLHSVSKPQTVSVNEFMGRHKLNEEDLSFAGQKRRRKPDQTRRIVPYTKYLSLMEENDLSPLDLSVHTNEVENVCKTEDRNSYNVFKDVVAPDENNQAESPEFESHKFLKQALQRISPLDQQISESRNTANGFPNAAAFFSLPQQEQLLSPELCHNNITQKFSIASKAGTSNHRQNEVVPLRHHGTSNSITKSKVRRKSQRSVIKQKLEDTFRQNGFLVKTKQVSDGEATFCKFRQLRKYTRYYLKSWQQHLPDEVHKMWKGFLPPKTVLPPVAGSPCGPMEDPT